MTNLLLLSLIFFSTAVFSYPCPESFHISSDVQAAQKWLEQFKGQFQLGNCQLEITACSPAERGWTGAPVGEVLIVDRDGRQAYVSILIPEEDNKKIEVETFSGRLSWKYLRRDKFSEEVAGRRETYQLEFRVDRKNPNQLKSIDLGLYSSNTRLDQPNGNQSHWFNCK